MPIDVTEFRGYLRIDKNALDDAVIEQPSLLYAVSEELAAATARRDELKELLATTDAKLDAKYRKDLNGKNTDTAIKNRVQKSQEHSDAFRAFISAKERADVLYALKDAFQARSYALRELCELYVANYFEEGSLRSTDKTDTVVYQERRKQIA